MPYVLTDACVRWYATHAATISTAVNTPVQATTGQAPLGSSSHNSAASSGSTSAMTGSPMLRVRVRRGLRVNTLRPSPLTAVDPMEEPPASPLLVSIAAADIPLIMRCARSTRYSA